MRFKFETMLLAAVCVLQLAACSPVYRHPNLAKLYNKEAMSENPFRNPIIVIPGLLGSKLVDDQTEDIVWGAFGPEQMDPATAVGARKIALPMALNKNLAQLKDEVVPNGALDRVIVNFLGFPISLNAYYNILITLGVGGYRDQGLAEADAIDWGDKHFTCFQFDYDWRRDIVENAMRLDQFIKQKSQYVQNEVERRYGIKNYTPRFNVVAHSMGGLVARYYLRYGNHDLPKSGRLPRVTWRGAEAIENLVIIGTPNAGSLEALTHLVDGYRPSFLLRKYPPAILGTMPSIYQLLPRSRHRPLIDSDGNAVGDILDPVLWQKNGWGLADPEQEDVLAMLLPDVADSGRRRRIAVDHQRKCLARAKQFSRAMDLPTTLPSSVKMYLVMGDSEDTPKTAQILAGGKLAIIETGPGDGVVLRKSALMDERSEDEERMRLVSPIHWSQVLFLFSDHLGLTKDPVFTDNILYFLLESPAY